jgi:hypothetical protein
MQLKFLGITAWFCGLAKQSLVNFRNQPVPAIPHTAPHPAPLPTPPPQIGNAFVDFTSSITAYVRVSRTPGRLQMTLPMNSR